MRGTVCGRGSGDAGAALKRIDALYANDDYRKAMMKGLLLGEARRSGGHGWRGSGRREPIMPW